MANIKNRMQAEIMSDIGRAAQSLQTVIHVRRPPRRCQSYGSERADGIISLTPIVREASHEVREHERLRYGFNWIWT